MKTWNLKIVVGGLGFAAWMILTVVINVANGAVSAEATSSRQFPQVSPASVADPSKVLTADACIKCHASEVTVWRQTPHSKTFEELHRRPKAKEIARNLGVRSIKYDDRCIGCHYTQKMEAGSPVTVAGVSCESCHGAAADWFDGHHDYGGPAVTRQTEPAEHRQQRIATAIAQGMRNPSNVFLMAQSCYRCHTVQDEQLVNIGGHHPGSLEFEFVSWSQGLVRHNFVRSDGQQNLESSPGRMRLMFVAGMMADLEASLRATAAATEVAAFGINAAERTARAAARLRSVGEKTGNPQVLAAVDIYDNARLIINQREPLTAAADKVAQLGFEFAASTDPTTLESLEIFIPERSRWK